jgi:hypothetical protein
MRQRRRCPLEMLVTCLVAICPDAAVSHKVRSKEDPASHFDVVGISIHREDTVREREPLELPPSIDSTARRAAALPNRVHDIHGSPRNPRRHRMKDQTLDQQVEYLAKKSSRQTSFQNLLKAEGESQSTATTTTRANPNKDPPVAPFWGSVVGVSALLAVSSWLRDPSSGQGLWSTIWTEKLGSILSVAWLPWVWAQPTKLKVLDLLVMSQFAVQPALLPYVRYEILPLIAKTFQTMLVAELWKRTWKWFFAQWDQSLWRQSMMVQEGDNGNTREWKMGYWVWPKEALGEPPSWLLELHSLVEGSVRGGIKRAFKKSIEAATMSSLGAWKDAMQEQILR